MPAGAERDTVSVKSDVPEPMIDAGLKLALTPEGIPAAYKAEAESSPPVPVTVTTA